MHPNRTSSEIDASNYAERTGNLKMIRYVKNNWDSPSNARDCSGVGSVLQMNDPNKLYGSRKSGTLSS